MDMKDVVASILARLKNQAKASNLSYQMCLQLFCQEEFLRRLSLSKYSFNFVLKGGLFIYTLTEFNSRATQDIDFLMRQLSNNLSDVKKIMEDIISVPTGNEYIKIEVLELGEITPDKEYHGASVKFCGYMKNIRIPFSIDIGIDDVVVPDAVMRSLKTQLDDFLKPEVYTYSLESTIAEKFDAILKRMEATSRMKDFFDIYYLSSMFDFEGRKLQEALWQTLQHRGTPYESDSFQRIRAFNENPFLVSQWERYKPSIQMELPAFHRIIERIIWFLEPVFNSAVHEGEFFKNWSSKQECWV